MGSVPDMAIRIVRLLTVAMKSPAFPPTLRSDAAPESNATEFLGRSLAVTRGKIKDPTGGMLHYYNPKLAWPAWARGGYKLIVGDHAFVRLAGR